MLAPHAWRFIARALALMIALAACAPSGAGGPAAGPGHPAAPLPGTSTGAAPPTAATAPTSPTAAPIASVTATAAPGAGAAQAAPPPLSPPVAVKVGSQGTVAERGIFIALERGYFAEEGLDVDLIPARTDQIPLLVTGELDFSNGGSDPSVFNAVLRGVGAKIVAYNIVIGENDHSSAFVVRKDLLDSGQYQAPKDLKGRTIGVPPASATPMLFLERWLAKGGLTLPDVQITNLPFADLVPALANRGLDAAFLAEPFITIAERQGAGVEAAPTGDLYPGMVGNVLTISPVFADKQPEAARRFVTARLRGIRDYYRAVQQNDGGRDDIVQILIKYTPIKDPNLYGRLLTSPVDPNGGMPERPLSELQDYYVQTGAVQQPVDVRQVLDPSYTDYALGRLGRLP
ncbi:MAG TPA: ABC transporter substrate-binding protein [Chloroflexota bacterium]|nr:ABC transporter substrate-binding protein [Chloroflexota bacterium]